MHRSSRVCRITTRRSCLFTSQHGCEKQGAYLAIGYFSCIGLLLKVHRAHDTAGGALVRFLHATPCLTVPALHVLSIHCHARYHAVNIMAIAMAVQHSVFLSVMDCMHLIQDCLCFALDVDGNL